MQFPWRKLLAWYEQAARPLPWRRPKPDPYEILVSEVMSQQSTMPTVIPYFTRWMERYPTVTELARANDEDVARSWAGLGYYSRARNLLKTARALVESGAPELWPSGVAGWSSLPGVGPYTAAAVSAIAFDEAVVPVDGNVLRVSARVFGIADPLNLRADRLRVEAALTEIAAEFEPGTRSPLAQAFMELGSLICRPQSPVCELCPLAEACFARRSDRITEFPLPKRRPDSVAAAQLAVTYRSADGRFLFRRIPPGRRLEGQWELPLLEWSSHAEGLGEIQRISKAFEVWGPVRHSITRYRYEVYGVVAGAWEGEVPEGHSLSDGRDLVLTTLSRKLLEKASFFD